MLRTGLFAIGFIAGLLLPKEATEVRAFQMECPGYTIIVAPYDGHTTMARAHDLAEFLGESQSQVCTLSVVTLKRPERK